MPPPTSTPTLMPLADTTASVDTTANDANANDVSANDTNASMAIFFSFLFF